jgi:hypothetical protein
MMKPAQFGFGGLKASDFVVSACLPSFKRASRAQGRKHASKGAFRVRISKGRQKLATVHRAMRGQDFQRVLPSGQYSSCFIYALEILPRIEFPRMRVKNGSPECFRENSKLVQLLVAFGTGNFDRGRAHREASILRQLLGAKPLLALKAHPDHVRKYRRAGQSQVLVPSCRSGNSG